MPRILFGLALIGAATAVIVSGATGAFFNDTETSTGNTFAAGAIDLKVDNESYYNRNVCAVDVNDIDTDQDVTEYLWQGTSAYPIPGTACTTSWTLDDLDKGLLFFNFNDLKPDDESEDTISLHTQNNAWACMDVSLTSNDDKSSTEPELSDGDVAEDINDTWDGELAQNLQFFWWADDGDNVFEQGEEPISNGVQTLMSLASTTGSFSVALADAQNNVWTPNAPAPIPANQTVYIAKAWCFGTLTLDPVPAGQGQNPSIEPGIDCDGSALNNITQTDGATLDIAFRAVQSRNNPNFLCGEERPRLATITVIKEVTNNNGGDNVIGDFQLYVDNGVVNTPVTSSISTQVAAGLYTVTETGVSGYVASFTNLADDCDANGQLTLNPGDNKVCYITNDDLPANITLIKNVIGGTAGPTQFGLRIDGGLVQNNTSVAVTSNAPHSINEDGRAGYSFTSISGSAQCPAVLGGTATLNEGEAITCTITNTAIPN